MNTIASFQSRNLNLIQYLHLRQFKLRKVCYRLPKQQRGGEGFIFCLAAWWVRTVFSKF